MVLIFVVEVGVRDLVILMFCCNILVLVVVMKIGCGKYYLIISNFIVVVFKLVIGLVMIN